MEKKFEELGLSQELVTVIREAGFETPSEIQERAIPLAIAGKDIIGAAATGSGKTLAFASPMIENLKPNKTVQALVLTPTRELAEQVANSIIFFSKNRRLNITSIYGGVNIENQIKNRERVIREYKLSLQAMPKELRRRSLVSRLSRDLEDFEADMKRYLFEIRESSFQDFRRSFHRRVDEM